MIVIIEFTALDIYKRYSLSFHALWTFFSLTSILVTIQVWVAFILIISGLFISEKLQEDTLENSRQKGRTQSSMIDDGITHSLT